MKLQLEYAICRCKVHLDLILVFIRRVARINLADSGAGAAGGSSYTALGYIPGETIRLSVDGNRGWWGLIDVVGAGAGPRRVTTNLFGCYSCRNYEIQCGEFAC